jgi:hypothetical protein
MQPLGGPAYGSPTAPVLPGSGGGTGFGPIPGGGEGGGAIRLHVGGTLTVNGRLAANGNSGLQDSSGGGSGGSIWVSAGLLAGNGQLTADGGWGELFSGGGGAGGRIATYSLGNTFSGSISVAGGLGAQSGGTGTVYQSTLVPFTGLSHAPSTTAVNPVTTVDVTFNAPLNPFTLDASDVSLQVPLGAVAVTNFTLSTPNLTRLRVTFPSQSTPGNYTLFVGPNVQSIYGDSLLQTYAATFGIALPTISGTVTNLAGQPVPGVLMVPDIPNSAVVTDANGNYALGFQPGTPFTLAPMLAGQYAVPASRSYFVGDSLPGQDFLMVDEIAPLLSIGSTGTNLLLSWSGIPGVNYQSLISTNLVQWQTYGAVMVGTNALMELLIPILHGEPQQYFRLTATN